MFQELLKDDLQLTVQPRKPGPIGGVSNQLEFLPRWDTF